MQKKKKQPELFVGMSEYGSGFRHAHPTGPRKSARQIIKEKRSLEEKIKRADAVRKKEGDKVLPMKPK